MQVTSEYEAKVTAMFDPSPMLEERKRRLAAAYEAISGMCKGTRRFHMTIPVHWDDTDIVLSAALADLREYVKQEEADHFRAVQEFLGRVMVDLKGVGYWQRVVEESAAMGIDVFGLRWAPQPVRPSPLQQRLEEAPDEMALGDADEYEYIQQIGDDSAYLWHDRKKFVIGLKGYRLMRDAAPDAAEGE